jgi:dTDP-glucose 4,6-dehydratase
MKCLVTGGAGFIGSNYIRYVLEAREDVEIVNFDALTYAGNLETLTDVEASPRYTFVKGDIACRDDVTALFSAHRFDAVLNFAAESHVDRSLHLGPEEFIRTNIMGTQFLLDAAREQGVARYLQVSTDEVYGSLGAQGRFTESSPIQPNNPYAATKAGADFMVRAAGRSHGLETVITRCSNNFGPFQFPEKLIPLMISNALEDKALPVYGDGMHVRDWIYVIDHARGIDTVLHHGKPGDIYNLGGNYDVPNIDIVKTILKLLDKPESLITYVKDRPGHDRRYAIDSSYIQKELGWEPSVSFEEGIQKTIDWYLTNRQWLDHIRSGAYRDYYDNMYGSRPAAS